MYLYTRIHTSMLNYTNDSRTQVAAAQEVMAPLILFRLSHFFSIYCSWQDATSLFVYIPVILPSTWGSKATAYLAHSSSKYGAAGEVKCFLGMLHFPMLRRNKYQLQQQGDFRDIGYPSDLDSSLTKISFFLLIFKNQKKINYSAIVRKFVVT
jgi:hypothetical protein